MAKEILKLCKGPVNEGMNEWHPEINRNREGGSIISTGVFFQQELKMALGLLSCSLLRD